MQVERDEAPAFLVSGTPNNVFSPAFQQEIERMIRPEQARVLRACISAGGRAVKRTAIALSSHLIAAAHAFIDFWNIPVLGPFGEDQR